MKSSSKSSFRSGLQQLESTMPSAVSKLWTATIHTDGNPIKTIIGFHTSDKRTKKDSIHRDKESEGKACKYFFNKWSDVDSWIIFGLEVASTLRGIILGVRRHIPACWRQQLESRLSRRNLRRLAEVSIDKNDDPNYLSTLLLKIFVYDDRCVSCVIFAEDKFEFLQIPNSINTLCENSYKMNKSYKLIICVTSQRDSTRERQHVSLTIAVKHHFKIYESTV